VSPYRLAAHLSTAFAIYSALLWTALDVAFPAAALADASLPLNRLLSSLAARRRAHGLAGLIAVTALSGAFVAGLDAGHAYNTFPLMGGRLVPQEYGSELPWWRNSFENTAAVQFHHRVLALSTAGGVWAAWVAAQVAPPLPRAAALATHALACAVGAQVSLGIATLLSCVPVWLGAAHQAGALTLLSAALVLLHTLRAPAHVKARAAAALREAATAPGARTGALVAAK
jgi:cytochrome c oxidase assembly protein subunit 15